MATGFEALIGYLDLKGDEERLNQVISQSVHIINGRSSSAQKRDAGTDTATADREKE